MRVSGLTSAFFAFGILSLAACVGDAPNTVAGPQDSGPVADATPDSAVSTPPDAGSPDAGSPDAGSPDAAKDAATEASSPDSGVDSGPGFLPSDLGASLVLWLDGSRAVAVDGSSNVTSWGDSSGSGVPQVGKAPNDVA